MPIFMAIYFVGCTPEEDVTLQPSIERAAIDNLNLPTDAVKIDFDQGNFAAGHIVSEVFCPDGSGPINVVGANPDFPGDNAAMIFDSNNPTGGDWDLGTPNELFGGPGRTMNGDPMPSNDTPLNNILIITEDFDADDPDDTDTRGTGFEFDFSGLGSVTMYAFDLIDVDGESANASVTLFDGDGVEIFSAGLPETGCNGVATVDLGATSGVASMVILLNGSGAIDNLCLMKESQDPGCTLTQGYWKTHAEQGPAGFDDTWESLGPDGEYEIFFLSGASYYDAISAAPKGNAYYILSQQYVAAVLNSLNGASTDAVSDALDEATSLFETYTPADIAGLKGNNATRKAFIELSETLDDYNKGVIGPGHCDESS